MSQVCNLIDRNFTSERSYQDAIALFAPYNPNLCTTVDRLPYATAREFVEERDRGEAMSEYLFFVNHKYIWLLSPNSRAIDLLVERCRQPLSPRQAAMIPYLVVERGQLGFLDHPTRHLRLGWDFKVQVERYRFACNLELVGLEDEVVTFIMSFVRRSLVPPEFWKSGGGSENSLYIVQYFVARGDDVTQRSIFVDGAWEMSTLSTNPFYVGFGDNFGFKSLSDTQIFPMQVWCRDESRDVQVRMQVMPKFEDYKWSTPTSFTFNNLQVLSGQVRTPSFAANVSEGRAFLTRILSIPTTYPRNIFSRAAANLKYAGAPKRRHEPLIWFVGQMDAGYELRGLLENACGSGPFSVHVQRVGETTESLKGTLTILSFAESEQTGTVYPASYEVHTSDGNHYIFEPLQEAFNFDLFSQEFFNCGARVKGSEEGLGVIGAQYFVDEAKVVRRMLVQLGFQDAAGLIPYYLVGPPTGGVLVASFLFFVFWAILVICVILIIKWQRN